MDVLRFLEQGNVTNNPEYNAKTKKGKIQPKTLVDYNPGNTVTDIGRGNLGSSLASNIYNLDAETVDKYATYNTYVGPNTSEDDLRREAATNQGIVEQVGNFLMQAVGGEMLLGTLRGFSDIGIGGINYLINRDFNGFTNPVSEYLEGLQDDLRNNFEILEKNPNKAFDFTDTGWVLNGLVNTFTTVSLMLPGYGTTKALGLISKIGKGAGWVNNGVTKLARGIAKLKNGNSVDKGFGAMRSIVQGSGKIENSIRLGSEIGTMAAFSRTAENFQEGREVYKDVYESSLKNLNNMPEDEREKLIARNPKFKGKNNEEIANEIASTSASHTFWSDYAMLMFDIPQLKVISSLWGKAANKATTAGIRTAAENVKRGLAEKELIENTFWHRTKDNLKYALSNPATSLHAMQLSEGVEEMYQGIAAEKGKEITSLYFDPAFTGRSIQSFLQDPDIWEQGFWGVVGAIGFQGVYRKAGDYRRKWEDHKMQEKLNKGEITADDYERWKLSEEKIRIANINGIQAKVAQFKENMDAINKGINPFGYVRDENGNIDISKGSVANTRIENDEQAALLKADAINKFIEQVTVDAVDSGDYNLIKSILQSQEFNDNLKAAGINISQDDINATNDVVKRMDEIQSSYTDILYNVMNIVDVDNPYIAKAAARNILNNKLLSEKLGIEAGIVDAQIAQESNGVDYQTYIDREINKAVNNFIGKLNADIALQRSNYENGLIGKTAYERRVAEYNKQKEAILKYAANNTTQGAIQEVRKLINESEFNDEVEKRYNEFVKTFLNETSTNAEPNDTIKDLVRKKITNETKATFLQSNLPQTNAQYQQLYDDFAMSMAKVYDNKIEEAIGLVKDYLLNAKDYEKAKAEILNETVSNRKLKEALELLKIGYFGNETSLPYIRINAQMAAIFEEAESKRTKNEQAVQSAAQDGVIIPDDPKATEEEKPAEEAGTEEKPAVEEKSAEVGPSVLPSIPPTTSAEEGATPSSPSTGGTVLNDDGTPVTVSGTEERVAIGEGKEVVATGNQEEPAVAQSENVEPTEEESKVRSAISNYIFFVATRDKEVLSDINKLKDSIWKYLEDRKLANDRIKGIFDRAVEDSVNTFNSLNGRSLFIQLAERIAIGKDDMTALTAYIGVDGINAVIDKFLEEYIKAEKIDFVESEGKYFINLQSLFNYLLNSDIDYATARNIYNNMNNYIMSSIDGKYNFTGYDYANGIPRDSDFFNELAKRRTIQEYKDSYVHIHPVENKGKDYEKALLAAANGAKTIAKLEMNANGNRISNVGIYVVMPNGKEVKVGILKGITSIGGTNNIFMATGGIEGFNFIASKTGNKYSLNVDFYFKELLTNSSQDAIELNKYIAKFYMDLLMLSRQYKLGMINEATYAKEVNDLISEQDANAIMNNRLVKELVDGGHFLISNELDKINAAKLILTGTGNIMFDKNTSEIDEQLLNHETEIQIAIKPTDTYLDFVESVYNNYETTYKIQEGLLSGNPTTIELEPILFKRMNKVEDGNEVNIDDLPLELDNTSPNKNTFVLIDNNRIISDNGTDLGQAPDGFGNHSMGFVVDEINGTPVMVPLKTAVNIGNTEIGKEVINELRKLLFEQFDASTATNERFDRIKKSIIELIGAGGLFKSTKYKVNTDNKYNNYISITIPIQGKDKFVITIYKVYKNGSPSHAITIGNTTYDTRTKQAEDAINAYLADIQNTLTFNKSDKLFKLKNGRTTYVDARGGKFNVTLNGKVFDAESYGHFLVKNRAFTSDIKADRKGKFVHYAIYPADLYINTNVKQVPDEAKSATSTLLDDLYIDRDKSVKNKTVHKTKNGEFYVDREYFLEHSGINQIFGIGTPYEATNLLDFFNKHLMTKRIYVEDELPNSAYMSYNPNTNRVSISRIGAEAMKEPKNALRLIIHENIHRILANSSRKQRYLDELKEVFDYTLNKLADDIANADEAKKSKLLAIQRVFDTIGRYDKESTVLEEFLVESMSNAGIVEYLNNTLYKQDERYNVSNMPEKKKTILEKIMEFVLKIFGINNGIIKKGSILAKEYQIFAYNNAKQYITDATQADLFDTGNEVSPVEKKQPQSAPSTTQPTTRQVSGTQPTAQPTVRPATQPVIKTAEEALQPNPELDRVKQETDAMISNFNSVVRQDFTDGKHEYKVWDAEQNKEVTADTSVTQLVHKGEKFDDDWGTPSSVLGNTLDASGREYFIDRTVHKSTPNLTNPQRLQKDFDRLSSWLDSVHGKGRYGVVTNEFAIAAKFTEDGKTKYVAGTMDLLVYTDTGDYYIYDFKTKRIGEGSGSLDDTRKSGYFRQVNMYRDILIANGIPANKVHVGSLIVFNVDYSSPKTEKFRESPDRKNVLQIESNGNFVDIVDKDGYINDPNYVQPMLQENRNNALINVIQNPTKIELYGIDKKEEKATVIEEIDEGLAQDILDEASIDDEFLDDENSYAATDYVEIDKNADALDAYIESANNSNIDVMGIKFNSDMSDFINEFPIQNRSNIAVLMASNELNYLCS